VEKRTAGERYSSPFFCAPNWDALITPLPGCDAGDGFQPVGADLEKLRALLCGRTTEVGRCTPGSSAAPLAMTQPEASSCSRAPAAHPLIYETPLHVPKDYEYIVLRFLIPFSMFFVVKNNTGRLCPNLGCYAKSGILVAGVWPYWVSWLQITAGQWLMKRRDAEYGAKQALQVD
jgi:hypothetical protein